MMSPPTRARVEPTWSASLSATRPLTFTGPRPELDLPRHVRAGSGIRRWGRRLVVLQDDVHALALVDEAAGVVTPLLLPPGLDGRRVFGESLGNKALKMDLEACFALPDGRLVALGSGSKPARERVVVVDPDERVAVIDAGALYASWRARSDFAGSELNIEGAVLTGDRVRLFQRGNGAPAGDLGPADATGDLPLAALLAWLGGASIPPLLDVRRYDLGHAGGVRFGFSDAVALPDGRIAFLAGAEASPDTYHDGEVVGCRFGVIDGEDVRIADIVDADGSKTTLKLEGLDLVAARGDAWDFVVVADRDDPETPAAMATLRVQVRGASAE